MRKVILKTALAATTIFFANPSFGQEPDAEGCKDHSFFNRLEKYYIYDCTENYNEYEFMMGDDKTQTFEGNVLNITYSYDGPFGPNLPSKLQVMKNYENAIIKMGGKKIYTRTSDDGYWTGGTFYLQKDGTEYWLGIYDLINNPVDQFNFILLTKEGMKQEIEAKEMFDKINSGEALSLYINFETGKSTIKNDSQSIIDELFAMLQNNVALKIIIEGHTDNVGSKETNKTLSESRATSVKNALVKKGISADRIASKGYGQENPVADNKTEEGKAKNRRVEIRKQ